MSPKEALEALDAAVQSWDHGKGEWASMDFQVDFIQPHALPLINLTDHLPFCS